MSQNLRILIGDTEVASVPFNPKGTPSKSLAESIASGKAKGLMMHASTGGFIPAQVNGKIVKLAVNVGSDPTIEDIKALKTAAQPDAEV